MRELDDMRALVQAGLHYTRVSERLRATIASLAPVMAAIESLGEVDPELRPELEVATEHLNELLSTLQRAFTFQNARFETTIEKLG